MLSHEFNCLLCVQLSNTSTEKRGTAEHYHSFPVLNVVFLFGYMISYCLAALRDHAALAFSLVKKNLKMNLSFSIVVYVVQIKNTKTHTVLAPPLT